MNTRTLLLTFGEEFMFSETNSILEVLNKLSRSREESLLIICNFLLNVDHSMAPKVNYMPDWLVYINNRNFYKMFRMEQNTFETFTNVVLKCDKYQLLEKKYTGGYYPVPCKVHLLVFLLYIASQDTLFSIGHRFSLSPNTVMEIVNKVLFIILKLKKAYIKFPSTAEELATISSGFKNYPGTVGAIDGTHVNVSVEESQQDSYIDRYRQHSINIMLICDSNKLFLYAFAGFPGSAHDWRVFENSSFYTAIGRFGSDHFFPADHDYHLIGDSAFALRKWLMVPFRDNNNLTAFERRHNYKLSSDRVVIEHAIGLLKERWRRLKFIKTYNICKTIEIASAACVLHNFCLLNEDYWDEMQNEDQMLPNNQHHEIMFDRRIDNAEARLKRNRIANQLANVPA